MGITCELEVKDDRRPRPDDRHPNRVTGIEPLVRETDGRLSCFGQADGVRWSAARQRGGPPCSVIARRFALHRREGLACPGSISLPLPAEKHESALSRRSRNRGPMSRRAASSRAAASVPGHVPAGVCPVKRLRRPSPPLRIGPRICDQGATAATAPRPAIAAMRCVCLCALSSSAVTFPLLSPKSRVELQHIIATRATRPLFGRIADMRYRRRPSNHRGDRIACCETPRITGSRLRRPRRAASWAPVGLRRCLRRRAVPA